MSLITDQQVQDALDYLHAETGPKARAAHEWMQDTKKVVLARLMSQSNAKTQGEREAWAQQHEDYVAHLARTRDCAELDYAARQRDAASRAVLDLYRTQSANQRGAGNLR